MKDISFEIRIKNSKVKLILTITDDLFKIIKIIRAKHKYRKPLVSKKEASEWRGVVISTFEVSSNVIHIVIERKEGKADMSTITHEIFHTTGRILRKIVINYYEDEESYAYLNGVLNSFIISKLIELNETISYSKHEDIKAKCVFI